MAKSIQCLHYYDYITLFIVELLSFFYYLLFLVLCKKIGPHCLIFSFSWFFYAPKLIHPNSLKNQKPHLNMHSKISVCYQCHILEESLLELSILLLQYILGWKHGCQFLDWSMERDWKFTV